MALIEPHLDKIGLLLWTKPNLEPCTEEHYSWIEKNRKNVYAIKFHPYHSKLAFNDDKMRDYFELAEHFKLPIVTHTANDIYSDPVHVYEISKQYQNLNIVMVHMGLGTDHKAAVNLIRKRDNLYGDSTWVNREALIKAFENLGSEKLLFGTDNTIDGLETLENKNFAGYCLRGLENDIGSYAYEKFIGKNAKTLFNITL